MGSGPGAITGQSEGVKPQYSQQPSTPPLKTASVVQKLGEEQLLKILTNLGVPSITKLSAQQRLDLQALIPIDQEYSQQTPNINILIFEKQKHDLEKILKNPIYRHPSLNVQLQDPAIVQTLSPEAVQQALFNLANHVAKLMSDAHFNPRNETPEAVLRDPHQMRILLNFALFSNLLKFDAPSLFIVKENVIGFMGTQTTLICISVTSLVDAARQMKIPISDKVQKVYEQAQIIPQQLSAASSPEAFQQLSFRAVETLNALDAEGAQIASDICKHMKSQMEDVQHLIHVESMVNDLHPTASELLEGPIPGREQEWLSQLSQLHQRLLPYLTVLEDVRQFLEPYISQAITPENENIHRGDLKLVLSPRFRSIFPSIQITDEQLEHLLLSAYLKTGARGVNLDSLKQTYKYKKGEATFPYSKKVGDRFVRVPVEEGTPGSQGALAAKATAIEHLNTFKASLLHSLRIDFASMNLSDAEIAWLAQETLFHPTTPLPSDWRNRLAHPN